MTEKKERKYVSDNAQLMSEWNLVRNTNISPLELTLGSNKKVWWKCSKGHEWQATVYNRQKGSGCPYCSGRSAITGKNDLQTINPTLAKEWNYEKNNGLTPSIVLPNSEKKVWWKCNNKHEWQATIGSRNNGAGCPYCSGRNSIEGKNDLQTVNPTLAKEWNYEKNNGLTPSNVLANSGKKVWWKCSNNHEWQAVIASRNSGCGCPYCSGRNSIEGKNDLQTVNPTLAKEWNYEKNNELTPSDVLANSEKKVWWKCNNGHEWRATVSNRNHGRTCPFCAGKKVLNGYNDLQTINPILAQEWNYEKNGSLSPTDVLPNSNKKVWWKCKKGHEWQASIISRNRGNGCSACNSERHTSFPEYAIIFYLKKYGLTPIHLYNDKGYELDIYIPSKNIAIEYDGYFWHKNKTEKDLEKNFKCQKDGIKLYRIREGIPSLNDISIDYLVQKNQEDLEKTLEEILNEILGYNVTIDLKKDSIAIDNLREYSEKKNSLLFVNPTLAKEWNYEKNGNLKPENFTANSGKKVWWKCYNGHEWQAVICGRNQGYGCPYCSGKYVITGVNDLQTLNPALAKEWNYEKNNGFTPSNVKPHSSKKVWWKCHNGHEWQASIQSRNQGYGCPYCSGKYVVKGVNDLQTLNPALAKEWNYAKNNKLTPSDVKCNSSKKVWWKCHNGHEWQATIGNRNRGTGCPQCAGRKPKQ